jgi:4-hydroxy-3-polyprenylbenzoate decarboxylase
MTAPDPGTTAGEGGAMRRTVPWRDTREWIERAKAAGELRVVTGASWQEDIGAITEMLDHAEDTPCVLFDEIPGYPAGRRVIVNCSGNPARQAITLNLPPEAATHDGLSAFWSGVLDDLHPIEPVEVESGPVFENILEGDDVDLLGFPTPLWHPKDGGRFIGTASMNIMKDPDSEWVNVGTYRNQIHSKDSMGIYISPGKHGLLIRNKYFERGERCPIVVVVGADPLLFMASCAEGIPYGQSEMAWAGGVRGEPIEVVRGKHTSIPFPATAEIAIEGWIEPGDEHNEGPYGEWMGYYAGGHGDSPVIRVSAIYHRNDPILLGCPQGKPPHEDNRFLAYLKSAILEKQMRAAGVPKVVGAWLPPEAANRMMTVVSIEQAYPGHATQALMVAGQCGASAYDGKLVVVVDEDIDIYDINDVMWAIQTRCDPIRDVKIIDRAWSSRLNPATHPDHRGLNSRLLIDATKPWEWKDRFAEPVISKDGSRATREQWAWILDPDARDPRA